MSPRSREPGIDTLYVGSDDPAVVAQLEACQTIGTALLGDFDGVCRKLGLRYFLDAGTLLGAFRHKGWIPWDDDVDVAMFRADFERLRSRPDAFPSYLALSDFASNAAQVTAVPRVNYLPSGLEWEERLGIRPPERQRIVVDIYLIDAAPASPSVRRLWLLATRVLQMALALRGTTLARIRANAPSSSVALAASAAFVLSQLTPRELLVRTYEALARIGRGDSADVIFLNHNSSVRGRTYPRDIFTTRSTTLEFEGSEYPAPEPTTFLETHYGPDYDRTPPPEQRRPHHYTNFWAEFKGRVWGRA